MSSSQALKRQYHLSLGPGCSRSCDYCFAIGNSDRIRKKWDIKRSLQKLDFGQYDHLRISCGIFEYNEQEQLAKAIQNKPISTFIQVHHEDIPLLLSKKTTYKNVEIVASTKEIIQWDLVKTLESKGISFRIFLVVCAPVKKSKSCLRTIPKSLQQKVELFFPYKTAHFKAGLKPKNIFKLRALFSHYKVSNRSDVFDPRIDSSLNLEPIFHPLIKTTRRPNNIVFSVIIPSYNNAPELLENLRRLTLQTYSKDNFEIIVVDDGSNDLTRESIQKFAKNNLARFNFKYLLFSRNRPRTMGDSRFRAGIARNLGVKYAVGQYLAFLDSDIVTPPHYLKTLLKEHQEHDVVQLQRLHLKHGLREKDIDFENEKSLTPYIEYPDGDYWKKFYKNASHWNSWPYRWKYICTYGLSMKTEDFKNAGWFKKIYLYYGFEDTDLGFRLHKLNKNFYLSKIKVYHLFGKTERNEYQHSNWSRQILLSKTAKVFYQNHLEPSIYKEFPSYMKL